LTSCEQEVVTNVVPEQNLEHTQQIPDFDRNETIDIPKGFDVTDNEKVRSFLTNLTEEQRNTLKESYRVKTFLKELNKYNSAYENMSEGHLFTDLDLNSLLSESELIALNDFKLNTSSLESRGCSWETCDYYSSTWYCGGPQQDYRMYCNGVPTGHFLFYCPQTGTYTMVDYSQYNLPASWCSDYDDCQDLATPSVYTNTSNGVRLQWNSVSGAQSYRVERETASGWVFQANRPSGSEYVYLGFPSGSIHKLGVIANCDGNTSERGWTWVIMP